MKDREPNALDRMSKWIDRSLNITEKLLIGAASFAAVAMMFHITADVLSRYLLNAPFASTIQVVSGYYMVLVSFFALMHAERHGGHIVVELFTQRLPRRYAARLEGLVGLIVFAYLVLLTWKTGEEAVHRMIEGEVWEIAGGYLSIWPSRWFVPIGCGFLAAHVLLQAARALVTRPHSE